MRTNGVQFRGLRQNFLFLDITSARHWRWGGYRRVWSFEDESTHPSLDKSKLAQKVRVRSTLQSLNLSVMVTKTNKFDWSSQSTNHVASQQSNFKQGPKELDQRFNNSLTLTLISHHFQKLKINLWQWWFVDIWSKNSLVSFLVCTEKIIFRENIHHLVKEGSI